MKQDKIHWISYIFIPIILFNFYLYVQPFNLLENELNVFILFNFILIILLSVTYFILKNFNKKYLIKKQKDNENNENEESSILKNNDNNENEESSILKNNDNNTNKIKNKDLNKIKENNEK